MAILADTDVEAIERFPCFGGACEVRVQGSGPAGSAPQAAALARRRLESWHRQFSRFDPDSELSRINGDPRDEMPVTAGMALFVNHRVPIKAWSELAHALRTGESGASKAFGMPTTLLVDPQGCELGVLAGPAEWTSEDAVKLVTAAIGG